jgi:hypothetical protein
MRLFPPSRTFNEAAGFAAIRLVLVGAAASAAVDRSDNGVVVRSAYDIPKQRTVTVEQRGGPP